MQPTPLRLSQAIWTAFRVAKPACRRSFPEQRQFLHNDVRLLKWQKPANRTSLQGSVRWYSDTQHSPEIEKKAKEARERIDQSLESRAELAQETEPVLKPEKEETIVHTLPESSSIVYERDNRTHTSDTSSTAGTHSSPSKDTTETQARTWATSQWRKSPLPSQIASLRWKASTRFSAFMDNVQSNIVTASHHLNDLTGYSGIERLKKEIEAQEEAVKSARMAVRDNRDRYSAAIAMRSTTQREVNDLLQRKHAWTSADLERFTHLYRSDHANEQAEQKTQQELSDSEAHYEEASTKLAKSILARYHEEQIWSDKIRQMSTWGTWGLMGLNVLLFIVFQILIEPWRRKRLVKGFEEKVQKALDEKDRASDEKIAALQQLQPVNSGGDQVVHEAVQVQSQGAVATAGEQVAEAIADAITGAIGDTSPSSSSSLEEIEMAAERITDAELQSDSLESVTMTSDATDTPASLGPQQHEYPVGSSAWTDQLAATYQHSVASVTRQFDDKHHVVLSRRELTIRILEGVVTGVALTCGIAFVVVRSR